MTRAALERPAEVVAPLLLGMVLAHATPDGVVAVRLTEVEAYAGVGEDPGSHAFRGRTPRNAVMFGPAGHLYAYFTYGMHTCVNVVTGPPDAASAVLLRAGEVVEGVALARSRRPAARRDVDLARGPARLATALGIALTQNGSDLLAAPFTLLPAALPPVRIGTGPRVGVAGDGGGAAYPWRFWIDGDPTVSAYRPARARRQEDPSTPAGSTDADRSGRPGASR